jgi:hypothetical protein
MPAQVLQVEKLVPMRQGSSLPRLTVQKKPLVDPLKQLRVAYAGAKETRRPKPRLV